jgi:hypothetical protein
MQKITLMNIHFPAKQCSRLAASGVDFCDTLFQLAILGNSCILIRLVVGAIRTPLFCGLFPETFYSLIFGKGVYYNLK